MILFIIIGALLSKLEVSFGQECAPSITTASRPAAPEKICSGQVIFEENFNELDKQIWQPEVTFEGGGVSLKMLNNSKSMLNSVNFSIEW